MPNESQPGIEESQPRPYLDELREFLGSRGVPTGKPADVAAFAARLGSDEALEEELGSILRSFVYRESEQIGRGELLQLVTEAVGGTGLDAVAPGMQANVRTIFLSLSKALRGQRPSLQPASAPAVPQRPSADRVAPEAPADAAARGTLPPSPSDPPSQSTLQTSPSAPPAGAPPTAAAVHRSAVAPVRSQTGEALPMSMAPRSTGDVAGGQIPQPATSKAPLQTGRNHAPSAKEELPKPERRADRTRDLASALASLAMTHPEPELPDSELPLSSSEPPPAHPDPVPPVPPAPVANTTAPGSAPKAKVVPAISASTPEAKKTKTSHPFSPWVPADQAQTARGIASLSSLPSATGAGRALSGTPAAAAKGERPRQMELSSDPLLEGTLREAEEEPEARSALSRWLVPLVAGILVLLGIGIYVGRSFWGRSHPSAAATTADGSAPITHTAKVVNCSPPALPRSSRSGLDERSRWAHNLLDQKLYEAALPELREIARMDPSYPGIRLDESDALLNMKKPDEARAAIDDQINISQCLARLPQPALRAYCGLHYPAASLSGCQAQMAHIRQQAELQAALVHLELGNRAQPSEDTSALSPHPRPHHKAAAAKRLVPLGPPGELQ